MTGTLWLLGLLGALTLAGLREWRLFVVLPARKTPDEPRATTIARLERIERHVSLLGTAAKCDTWIRLGQLYTEQGKYARALSYLERAARHIPETVEPATRASLWRSIADLRERDLCPPESLAAAWQSAADTFAQAPRTHRTLHSYGELLRTLGHWPEAYAVFRELAERQPPRKDAPALKLVAAGAAYDAGKLTQAEALAEQVLAQPEAAPLHPTAQLLLGAGRGARGDNDGARAAYSLAPPSDSAALLALCALRDGNPDEALSRCDAAQALAGTGSLQRTLVLIRAEALIEKGRYHEAMGALLAARGLSVTGESALEERRSQAVLSLLLAWAELCVGEREPALRHLASAEATLRLHPRLKHWCAAVRAALTTDPDALTTLYAALEALPEDSETQSFCRRVLAQTQSQ